MKETIRKCLYFIGPGRSGRWLLLVVFALVASGFEAGAAMLVFALLGMVTKTTGEPAAGLLANVRDTFLSGWNDRDVTLLLVASMGVFFIARAAVTLGQGYVESRVAQHAGARLSVRLLSGYLRMPYEFHLRRNSADLIRNAYDTVQVVVREVFGPAAKLISELLIVAGVLTVLVVSAPAATGLAVLVLGPPIFLLLRVIHPWVKRLGATRERVSSMSLRALQQALQGSRDIKILGREEYFRRLFADQRAELAHSNYWRSVAEKVPRATLETALLLFIATFFAITTLTEGSALGALAVLGLFTYAALRLLPSLNRILAGLNSLKYATPAVDQLYEDLVLIEGAGGARKLPNHVEPLPFTQEITVDRVSFRYEGTQENVLTDVSLSITRGEFIGVVGPTGGGKSTLVDLLLGLLQPTSGTILVDGVNMADHTAAWQRNLGMVPQTVFLVDDTLKRNIALGIADSEIVEEHVWEAVRMARLERFVAQLPGGLETVVGERGVRLSGGQRQRVAIARALYHRPNVLVLDEGTSALDNRTEAELMEELQRLHGTRTIITIAHRLSTVRKCDRIVLVQAGRVVDTGSFEELEERNPDFGRMVHSSGDAPQLEESAPAAAGAPDLTPTG